MFRRKKIAKNNCEENKTIQAVPANLKSLVSFVMGAFFGLAFGFTLGAWRVPALVMEACK